MSIDEDRRRFDKDHDLLVSIHAIVERMDQNYESHVQQDKDDFAAVHKRISDLAKYVWMGVGGIAAIEIGVKLLGR